MSNITQNLVVSTNPMSFTFHSPVEITDSTPVFHNEQELDEFRFLSEKDKNEIKKVIKYTCDNNQFTDAKLCFHDKFCEPICIYHSPNVLNDFTVYVSIDCKIMDSVNRMKEN